MKIVRRRQVRLSIRREQTHVQHPQTLEQLHLVNIMDLLFYKINRIGIRVDSARAPTTARGKKTSSSVTNISKKNTSSAKEDEDPNEKVILTSRIIEIQLPFSPYHCSRE